MITDMLKTDPLQKQLFHLKRSFTVFFASLRSAKKGDTMNNFIPKLTEITEALTKHCPSLQSKFNSVIIVAAGTGERMGNISGKSKQMAELCGIPVVVRSILAFEACDFINEIIVVAKENEIGCYENLIAAYNLKKTARVVRGSNTRQKSVLEGLAAVSSKSEYLAIHDAARCLVTSDIIKEVFTQAYIYGAAVAAEKMTDTVKKSDNYECVSETIDRTWLWRAQTPQIFKTDIYRAAAYIAQTEETEVTDDSALAENIGFKVKLVDCGSENIKLTKPSDMAVARAILELRERNALSIADKDK